MQKQTIAPVSRIFDGSTSRAPENSRISFMPPGINQAVTAVVKKRNGNTARVEFKDPTKDGKPSRVDIPLDQEVTIL